MSKKIQLLKKAKKVNFNFRKMDKETKENLMSLINHLQMAKVNG